MEEKIHHLEQGVLSGNREAVRTACRQLLEAGMPPQKIVRFGLLPCMDTLGQQLSRREKFIPQIMMSARAAQDGIEGRRSTSRRERRRPLCSAPSAGTSTPSERRSFPSCSGAPDSMSSILGRTSRRRNLSPRRGRTTPTSSRSRQCSPRRSPA